MSANQLPDCRAIGGTRPLVPRRKQSQLSTPPFGPPPVQNIALTNTKRCPVFEATRKRFAIGNVFPASAIRRARSVAAVISDVVVPRTHVDRPSCIQLTGFDRPMSA